MNVINKIKIDTIITELYKDSKNDFAKVAKGMAKTIFRPIKPSDFKDAYLAISKEQGQELVDLIKENNFKNIVEFGTSFGISTLFLAKGVMQTGGHIITTELIVSKAKKAFNNFERAGVNDLIELRIGDAMESLKNHDRPIDFLFLDGWKDLYLPLFQMLESHFHDNTIIYVDNANMAESRKFLNTIDKNSNYQIQYKHQGNVALIS